MIRILDSREEIPGLVQANKINVGNAFLLNNVLYLRVKPIGFLTNSTILSDVFSRGDIIVYKPLRGTIACLKGTEYVKPVNLVMYKES